MLTIKTREYPKNSLISRFFDWTYKLSHGYGADPEYDKLSTTVKDLYSQAYLISVNIEFPEPDLYDVRTLSKLSDKKPFEVGSKRLNDYRATVDKNMRKAVSIKYQKDSYQIENMLVYNDNHYTPVFLKHQDGDYAPGWYIYSPKLEKWVSVNRVFEENQSDIESGKKLKYSFFEFVVDEAVEKECKNLNARLRRMDKVKHIFYRVFHTIDSTILCIRFPFLYPRNRFSGLHYNNWKLLDYIKNLHSRNSALMSVRVMNDSSKEFHYNTPYHPDINTSVEDVEGNGKHTITTYSTTLLDKTEYVVCRDERFTVFPRKIKCNVVWCHSKHMHTYHPDFGWIDLSESSKRGHVRRMFSKESEDKTYTDCCYEYVKNLWTERWEKFLKWFHEYVLGFIFCVPTSNELDAMDNGWLKAFGIQLCKELRAELIKSKFLFNYRISQIKEKYGGLRWYDNGQTKEMHQQI